MNIEKQIEEMAKDLDTCPYIAAPMGCDKHEGSIHIAEYLHAKDYRKASDVARELFEEIEEGVKAAVSALQFENNPIHRQVKHETYSSLMRFIKTFIEKKFTQEE